MISDTGLLVLFDISKTTPSEVCLCIILRSFDSKHETFSRGEGNFKKISHGESAASFSKPPYLPSADMTLKIQSVVMPDTRPDFLVQNSAVTSTATNLSHRIISIMAAFN